MRTRFRLKILEGRDHSGDLGVDEDKTNTYLTEVGMCRLNIRVYGSRQEPVVGCSVHCHKYSASIQGSTIFDEPYRTVS
jgi:hypothetical protein